MYISGIRGFREISIEEIDYYYQYNRYVVFRGSDGEVFDIEFNDYSSARDTADQFFDIYYKQLATVARSDGRCYLINIAKISSHSASAEYLNIIFSSNELLLNCVNSSLASKHNLYLTKVKIGNSFLSDFGGVRKYLNTNGTEDYSTLTAAIAAYTPGDAIIVRAGTYADNINIPDGLIMYCEDGAIFTGQWDLLEDDSFDIMGYGDWSNSGTSFYTNISKGGDSRPVSYLEFNQIVGGIRTFLSPNMVIKGYSFTKHPSAGYGTLLDTDNAVNFDIDIVSCETSGSEIFYVQYISEGGNCIIRNGRFINNGVALINNNSANYEYTHTLINGRFKNTSTDPQAGIIVSYDNTETQRFKVFNCMFETASSNSFWSDAELQRIELYGRSFSNKPGNKDNYDLYLLVVNAQTVIGDSLTQTDNLNYALMSLTNKPVTAHFKTGQTAFVWMNNNLQKGSIKRVISEVSNPANDSNGIQDNLYEFNEFTGIFTEDKVFASPNHALSVKSGNTLADLTYLDTTAMTGFTPKIFTKIGGGEVTDLSGYVFDNCDLSDLKATFQGAIVDNTNLNGSTMHADIDTKAEFKAWVSSYDPVTTIWTDGNPIGA